MFTEQRVDIIKENFRKKLCRKIAEAEFEIFPNIFEKIRSGIGVGEFWDCFSKFGF